MLERTGLTYLGQAGILVETGDLKFLIDPYLSNYVVDSGIGSAEYFSRGFPPPVRAGGLSGINLVFISHDHADHCDPDTLLPIVKKNPGVIIVCPRPVSNHLIQLGVDQKSIFVPQVLEFALVNGLEFYAVPAAHYSFDQNPNTGEYAYFGFVIKVKNNWLFHAGDTINYSGFTEKILRHVNVIDIALLPVNGRDEKREEMGIVGNLKGIEAFQLAVELGSKILLPLHNDLFSINSEDPKLLDEAANTAKKGPIIKWMDPGEHLEM